MPTRCAGGWRALRPRSAAGPAARLLRDPRDAVLGAQAVYTDVWVSMGDEGTEDRRRRDLAPYRIDDALLDRAGADAVALHCLPAHAGDEITYEVLHGPRSAVWDQAENRMLAAQAVLLHLWTPGPLVRESSVLLALALVCVVPFRAVPRPAAAGESVLRRSVGDA